MLANVVLPTPAGPVITAPRRPSTAAANKASSSLRPTSGHVSTPKPYTGANWSLLDTDHAHRYTDYLEIDGYP